MTADDRRRCALLPTAAVALRRRRRSLEQHGSSIGCRPARPRFTEQIGNEVITATRGRGTVAVHAGVSGEAATLGFSRAFPNAANTVTAAVARGDGQTAVHLGSGFMF